MIASRRYFLDFRRKQEKQRTENTVCLLGSIHLLKQDSYPLDKTIEDAYRDSSKLFFEINLGKVDQQRLRKLVIAGLKQKGYPVEQL